jgi:8-oxo-dGTP pyrophosphatase MutT (NUDIX family)
MPTRVGYLKAIEIKADVREAAVAIILFENQKMELSTILIQRQEYDGNHSGQFGFPGGKKEQFDNDLMHTAARECEEEIGVNPMRMELLRKITPLYIPVSNFVVHPYVFFSQDNAFDYVKDEREVKAIVEVQLNKLFSDQSLVHKDVATASYTLKRVPHFENDAVSVWGATALMLNEIKQILE